MMNRSPKKPRTRIVVDCQGEPATIDLLYYCETFVRSLLGGYKTEGFWITRDDLFFDFDTRHSANGPCSFKKLEREKFHTPTFDFYLRDRTEDVPVASLVNVKIPDAEDLKC